MNLKEWAEREGVSYTTARRWFASGKLSAAARKVGGLVLAGDGSIPPPEGVTAVYALVSAVDQEADLDRQVARVTAWAASEGLTVGRVVTEVGSALDGKRRKFLALLRDERVTVIVVEHRGRFAGFGAEYVQAALAAQGRRLLVADPSEVDDDLVLDVTEILTSLCARLYGRRAAANRTARAIEAVTGGSRESPPGVPLRHRRSPGRRARLPLSCGRVPVRVELGAGEVRRAVRGGGQVVLGR